MVGGWERDLGDRPVRVHGRLTMAARSATRWSSRATLLSPTTGAGLEIRCDCTPGGGALLGWTSAELRGLLAADIVHPDERDLLDDVADGTGTKTGSFIPLELRILARDSRYWWTGWRVVTAPDGRSAVHGLTYLRPAEWGCHVATWRWNVDRDVVTWSPELLDMFALRVGPPASLAGFLASVHEDDRDTVAAHLRLAVSDGESFRFTFRCRASDARDAWFHASGCCDTEVDGARVVRGLVKFLNPPWTPPSEAVIGCG